MNASATPLLAPSAAAPDTATIWLRMLVVAWWLVSARVVVAVLYFTLRHDPGQRSAKLVIDLTAAAIYVGTALIVLTSVLALPIAGLVATSGVVAHRARPGIAEHAGGRLLRHRGRRRGAIPGRRPHFGWRRHRGRVIETNWRSIKFRRMAKTSRSSRTASWRSSKSSTGACRAGAAPCPQRFGARRRWIPSASSRSSTKLPCCARPFWKLQRPAWRSRGSVDDGIADTDHVLRGGDVIDGGDEEPPATPRPQAVAPRRPARSRPGRPRAAWLARGR